VSTGSRPKLPNIATLRGLKNIDYDYDGDGDYLSDN
jgi:hypothetical protein